MNLKAITICLPQTSRPIGTSRRVVTSLVANQKQHFKNNGTIKDRANKRIYQGWFHKN